MLTPKELQDYPDNITDLFIDIEQDILSEIAERLSKDIKLSETQEYQIKRLHELGYDLADIEQELQKRVTREINNIDTILEEAAEVSYKNDKKAYRYGNKDLIAYQDNSQVRKMIDLRIKDTKDNLINLTRTSGFAYDKGYKDITDYYKQVLNKATLQTGTGLYDVDKATRTAVNSISNNGIIFIDYESGIRRTVEGVVRSSILTGLNQITGEMSLMNADSLGQNLMELTAHIGARPSHSEWQGQIVSLDGTGDYLTLDDIGYGDAGGFQGVNCRHGWYPYFESSTRNYTDLELQEIDPEPFEYNNKIYTAYEATQQQRYLERRMRATKKKIILYESAGLDYTSESIKLKRLREEYKNFSYEAGIRAKNSRHFTYGYGRSIAQKARWKAT